MSLPIPIIAGNFEKFHKTQHKKNKLLKRRAAVVTAREKEERERLAEMYGERERLRSPVSLLTTDLLEAASLIGDRHVSNHECPTGARDPHQVYRQTINCVLLET